MATISWVYQTKGKEAAEILIEKSGKYKKEGEKWSKIT